MYYNILCILLNLLIIIIIITDFKNIIGKLENIKLRNIIGLLNI